MMLPDQALNERDKNIPKQLYSVITRGPPNTTVCWLSFRQRFYIIYLCGLLFSLARHLNDI